jgi:hypothetical protein
MGRGGGGDDDVTGGVPKKPRTPVAPKVNGVVKLEHPPVAFHRSVPSPTSFFRARFLTLSKPLDPPRDGRPQPRSSGGAAHMQRSIPRSIRSPTHSSLRTPAGWQSPCPTTPCRPARPRTRRSPARPPGRPISLFVGPSNSSCSNGSGDGGGSGGGGMGMSEGVGELAAQDPDMAAAVAAELAAMGPPPSHSIGPGPGIGWPGGSGGANDGPVNFGNGNGSDGLGTSGGKPPVGPGRYTALATSQLAMCLLSLLPPGPEPPHPGTAQPPPADHRPIFRRRQMFIRASHRNAI